MAAEKGIGLHNPWTSDQRQIGSLKNALLLAEKTGHYKKRLLSNYDNDEEEMADWQEKYASLRLIRQLKEISERKRQLKEINLEVTKRTLDKETCDITHSDILKSRVDQVRELNVYLRSVIDQRDSLVSRLREPFVSESIKMDVAFHSITRDFIPRLAPLVTKMTSLLDDVEWAASISNSKDPRLDAMLTELLTSTNTLLKNFKWLTTMRSTVNG